MAKKRYKTIGFDPKTYAEAASESQSAKGTQVERPLLKIDGVNAGFLHETFALPDIKETDEDSVEVAFRILGFPVTKELLPHLPNTITEEHVGALIPYLPFSIHRRFGVNWTDFICPESVRKGKCPICMERVRLFRSDDYKSGKITKDDIIRDGGFGTRMKALFFAQVFTQNGLTPVCPVVTNLTNEQVAGSKKDNFFDKVGELCQPKKLLASETLPQDYYADGDGGRWLIAEYTRSTYSRGSKGFDFWKLSKVGMTKDMPGVGDASKVWWPEVDGEDAALLVKPYDLLNMASKAMLESEVADKVSDMAGIINGDDGTHEETREETPAASAFAEPPPSLTWAQIVGADLSDLITLGVQKGLDAETLTLLGESNIAALRRNVAKVYGVVPTRVVSGGDEDEIPF